MYFRRFLLPVTFIALCALVSQVEAQESAKPLLPLQMQRALSEYFEGRTECMNYYHFGSVLVSVDPHKAEYSAGETVRITGRIKNENNIPLVHARGFVRIEREDSMVDNKHWRPVVFEGAFTEEMTLGVRESIPFEFTYNIPARAPNGNYGIRFSVHANDAPFGGIFFITNMSASSTHFAVQGTKAPSAVEFDRSTVVLNGQPQELRQISPPLSPNEAVTLSVELKTQSQQSMPVRLRASLYKRSDVASDDAIIDEITDLVIDPRKPTMIPLRWEKPRPGAYEFVIVAVPFDREVMPSILRMRVQLTGDAPIVIFNGVGEINRKKETAKIIACSVNASQEGAGDGRLEITVSTNGKVISEASGSTTENLSAVNVEVPLSVIEDSVTISAVTKNEAGEVADESRVTYERQTLLSAIEENDEMLHPAAGIQLITLYEQWRLFLLILGTAAIGMFVVYRWYLKRK